MKKAPPLVLSFLLLFSLFSYISATRASANNKIMVGVFYYPWYDGEGYHCNDPPAKYNISDISNTSWRVIDVPVLGDTTVPKYLMYASDNIAVIKQHLDWFKYAGIDFGIISWWGNNSFEDSITASLFKVTESYAPWFRWVISIEWCYNMTTQPLSYLEYLRNYVYDHYCSNYSDIWLNDSGSGKPFLFWMNADDLYNKTVQDEAKNDSKFETRFLGQANYSDWMTWTPYRWGGATCAFQPSMNEFMCVMPRYDERGLSPDRLRCSDPYLNGSDGSYTDPLNGLPLYDKQWEEVISNASAGKIKYVGIATWNDFTERTQIEPCYDNTSAYKDDPFFLLNKTKYYISMLKDSEAPTITNVSQVPSGNVTEYQNVTVYANVSDTGSRVNRVLLNWTTNVTYTWSFVSMNFNSETGSYEGVILGQKAGTSVNYSLTAYDNAGNWRVDDNQTYYYNYVVTPEFSPLLVLPLFMLATLAAIIVYKRKGTHSAKGQNHAG